MGKALVAAGVAAIVVGGGVLGYGLMRPKPTVVVDAMPFAGKIDSLLAQRRDALRKRTDAVAQEDHVRGGLGDQKTAHDMFERGELDLQVQPNEVLEFGQVIGGAAMRLQLIPADGKSFPHHGQPTERVVVSGEQIVLQRVSAVALKITTQAPVGYVAISQTISKTFFDDVSQELEAGNSGLIVAFGDQKVVLGKPFAPGVKTTRVPLQFDPAVTIEAAVPVGAGNFLPFLVAGGGGAGLGLLLLVLGFVRRPSGASISATPPVAGTTAPGTTAPGTTQPGTTQVGNSHPVGFAATTLALGTPNSTVGTGAFPAASAPLPLGPGAVLGRWEIVQRLGSGGMADVFKARSIGEAGFAKMVALKVMHAHLARNERAVDHFLDEARLAAQIQHPNVVQILDLGKIGGEYAIAMEYVDGVDLERLLQGAREAGRVIPLNVAVGILRRIS
ncbi:MAG: protein kinase, partial [Kofleriaceae bacterium]|nr:protein kinase [Kofleriaceae bacterium]